MKTVSCIVLRLVVKREGNYLIDSPQCVIQLVAFLWTFSRG